MRLPADMTRRLLAAVAICAAIAVPPDAPSAQAPTAAAQPSFRVASELVVIA